MKIKLFKAILTTIILLSLIFCLSSCINELNIYEYKINEKDNFLMVKVSNYYNRNEINNSIVGISKNIINKETIIFPSIINDEKIKGIGVREIIAFWGGLKIFRLKIQKQKNIYFNSYIDYSYIKFYLKNDIKVFLPKYTLNFFEENDNKKF